MVGPKDKFLNVVHDLSDSNIFLSIYPKPKCVVPRSPTCEEGGINIAVYAEVGMFEKKMSDLCEPWITGTRYVSSTGARVWKLVADHPNEIYDVPDHYRL